MLRYICLPLFLTFNHCNFHCTAQEQTNRDARLHTNRSCIPRRSSVRQARPADPSAPSGPPLLCTATERRVKTQKQERFLIEYLDAYLEYWTKGQGDTGVHANTTHKMSKRRRGRRPTHLALLACSHPTIYTNLPRCELAKLSHLN